MKKIKAKKLSAAFKTLEGEPSSGNIFEDIGLQHHHELIKKVPLVRQIFHILETIDKVEMFLLRNFTVLELKQILKQLKACDVK